MENPLPDLQRYHAWIGKSIIPKAVDALGLTITPSLVCCLETLAATVCHENPRLLGAREGHAKALVEEIQKLFQESTLLSSLIRHRFSDGLQPAMKTASNNISRPEESTVLINGKARRHLNLVSEKYRPENCLDQ